MNPNLFHITSRSSLSSLQPMLVHRLRRSRIVFRSISSSTESESYKKDLEELMQKMNLTNPVYHTIAQGSPLNMVFISSVVVAGVEYNSDMTFPTKKAAENNIAQVAFEGTAQKLNTDALSCIEKEPMLCKSLLHEFAAKMKMEVPPYHSVNTGELFPWFTSYVVYNGVPYFGEGSKSKKMSEQLAARAVIVSILGMHENRTTMSLIINSRLKPYGEELSGGEPAVGRRRSKNQNRKRNKRLRQAAQQETPDEVEVIILD